MLKGPTGDSENERELLSEVLAQAHEAGHEVSKRQLKRWRDEGLLSKPEKVGLGRGRGTKSFYPPGTGELVTTIAKELREARSLTVVGVKAWFQGYPLTTYVRDQLLAEIRAVDRRYRAAQRAYDSEITEKPVTEWVDMDRLPAFGWLRQKMGRASFFYPARYGIEAMAGATKIEELLPILQWSDEASSAIKQALIESTRRLGFDNVDKLEIERLSELELAELLREMSEEASPGAAFERAQARSEEEWTAIRDQAVKFVRERIPGCDEPEVYSFLVFRSLLLYPTHRKNPVSYLREELDSGEPLPTDTVEELFRIALA